MLGKLADVSPGYDLTSNGAYSSCTQTCQIPCGLQIQSGTPNSPQHLGREVRRNCLGRISEELFHAGQLRLLI